jgi:hypothetical protein
MSEPPAVAGGLWLSGLATSHNGRMARPLPQAVLTCHTKFSFRQLIIQNGLSAGSYSTAIIIKENERED